MYAESSNMMFEVEMCECMVRYFEMCFGVFGVCGSECLMKKL